MSQVRSLFISCRRAVVGRLRGLESQRSAGGAALGDLALHASKPHAVLMLGDSVTSPASGVRHHVSLPGCAALKQLADHRQCSSIAPNRKPVHILVPASSGLSRCESAPRTRVDQYMDARGRSDAQVANALWAGRNRIGAILRVQFTQQVEEMGRVSPPPRGRPSCLRRHGMRGRASTRTKHLHRRHRILIAVGI
jgi:hypothetical protein